ncbi:MAG: Fic family protein [Clostridium sp.]|nr:Fic family protein [Clostridium sp.]
MVEFESIHSFIDGNSRTGRLPMNPKIMEARFPLIGIK